jgi:hypothetical protein
MSEHKLRVLTRNRDGPREQHHAHFPTLRSTLTNALVDLFEDARHTHQHRWTHFAQVWTNRLQRLREVNSHALVQVHVHRLPLENMRQRQHGKRLVVFAEIVMP